MRPNNAERRHREQRQAQRHHNNRQGQRKRNARQRRSNRDATPTTTRRKKQKSEKHATATPRQIRRNTARPRGPRRKARAFQARSGKRKRTQKRTGAQYNAPLRRHNGKRNAMHRKKQRRAETKGANRRNQQKHTQRRRRRSQSATRTTTRRQSNRTSDDATEEQHGTPRGPTTGRQKTPRQERNQLRLVRVRAVGGTPPPSSFTPRVLTRQPPTWSEAWATPAISSTPSRRSLPQETLTAQAADRKQPTPDTEQSRLEWARRAL